MFYSKLSLASLLSNKKQYTSLFIVCLVGTALILSATMITDGMLSSVRQKARQYYGGDIQFLGGNRSFDIKNPDEIILKLDNAIEQKKVFYKRYDYDAKNTLLYFEGESVRQRVFKGVDFEAEKELFSKFNFLEGDAKSIPEHNSIVISSPIAEKLGIKSGDSITLQIRTVYGYTNTINLIVTGIFKDSSIFGMYTSYIDIDALRSATGYPKNYVNRICILFKNGVPSDNEIRKIQKTLEKDFNIYPQTDDKNIFYDALLKDKTQKMPLYALITLDTNIKDLEMLIDALKTVVILITIILLAIISVGIASSYRVIVMKRITEIGIYRALGMKHSGVRKLFLTESFLLIIISFIASSMLSALICVTLAQFKLSFIPAFDIFLTEGHLLSKVKPIKLLLLLLVIIVTTLGSILFTIRKAIKISPVGALATTA